MIRKPILSLVFLSAPAGPAQAEFDHEMNRQHDEIRGQQEELDRLRREEGRQRYEPDQQRRRQFDSSPYDDPLFRERGRGGAGRSLF